MTFDATARATHEAWRGCSPWPGDGTIVGVIGVDGAVQHAACENIDAMAAAVARIGASYVTSGLTPAGFVMHGVTDRDGQPCPLTVCAPLDGEPWALIDGDDGWRCEPDLTVLVARWLDLLVAGGN